MDFRKVTIRIVFTFAAVVAIGGMIAGCSSEEFEGPKKTLATRSVSSSEDFNDVVNPTDTINAIFNYNVFPPLEGDSIALSFYIDWAEGASDKRIEADQSEISIVMHTISPEHVYHKAFKNKHVVLEENNNTNEYRIKITDYDLRWFTGFDGINAKISYQLLTPLRRVFDIISNSNKLVGDTISGEINTKFGSRNDFRSFFKYDADYETNNR